MYYFLFTLSIIFHVSFSHYAKIRSQNKILRSKTGLISNDYNKTQVLIIGAGIAGLETARLLNMNQIKTINLEARDRIGGRIWSVESKNGHIFDLGAAWIHGVNGSIPSGLISNQLWELTNQAKIPTRGTDKTDSKVFYVNENINKSSKKSEYDLKKYASDFLDYVGEQVKVSNPNKSLSDFSSEFSSLKNFSVDEEKVFLASLSTEIENDNNIELDQIGGKIYTEQGSYHCGEEAVFHKSGYGSLIQFLAKDNNNIRLNQIVTKIDYSSTDLIRVYTESGEVYEASFVLVTVPLGVLKARSIQFVPELPTWKTDSIDRIGFGIMDKIVLVWDKAWWNVTNFYFKRVSNSPSVFNYWVNANKWNDRPALIGFLIGKEALRSEKLGKIKVTEEALKALSSMYPEQTIPEPVEVIMTNWKSDPFSNGSYSFVSKNQLYTDTLYLSLPVENKLLFAGEATSVDSVGYAHGALDSARREATRLLFSYNLLKETENSASNNIHNLMRLIYVSVFYLFSI